MPLVRVCIMKISRWESQGNTKTKFFYIEKSEINPVEMEMRHKERMTSKNIRSSKGAEEVGLGVLQIQKHVSTC